MDRPDTIHGRLLEAVHITGYTFERACSELEWLLTDDRWKQVGGGCDDINAFLATINLSDFKIVAEQRKRIAKRLAKIEASQRATARLLGVDHKTINGDLRGENSPPAKKKSNDGNGAKSANGENSPPTREWFDDPAVDPAKLAKAANNRNTSHIRRAERLEEINSRNRPLESAIRYPVIYADPPWKYENPPIGAGNRSIENHYPTMTLEEICALPVASEIAASDGMLYLWATAPKLAECMQVVTAWGFVYRTNMVWDKGLIGNGYHARNQHELLLICKRGEIPPPLAGTQPPSIYSERRGEHSAKPDFFAGMIERAYPTLAKIELFRRGAPRPGWACWGNQVEEAVA
ncbi:MT-A70 family methyltransferase [Sinorhizobium fredii]|uniref:MT-A70 family methyltransferase n=1 Tax=Rhizobium fredii TaxID=380 RepID=UPI0030AA1DA1